MTSCNYLSGNIHGFTHASSTLKANMILVCFLSKVFDMMLSVVCGLCEEMLGKESYTSDS